MSAWYILSSMGIYSVSPGKIGWETTVPYFDSVKIKLEDGSTRAINPKTPPKDLEKLGFEELNPLPTKNYLTIIPAPIVTASSVLFDEPITIKIKTLNSADRIYYQIQDSTKANSKFRVYRKPFRIAKTSTVKSFTKRKENKSTTTTAVYYRKPNPWSIRTASVYNPQYDGGGPAALIDGIRGEKNWRKGNWQGFQGQNFESVIDLKSQKYITEISSTYLQDSRSWILMPTKVEYYLSSDQKDFFKVATVDNTIDPKLTDLVIKSFTTRIPPTQARYLKIIAKNYGTLPDWHQGVGGEAFIFIDEITVR